MIEVWPLSLDVAIPLVPVPLLHPDPDVVLDLGQALQQVYESARYERRINYKQPPPPPALPQKDLDWLEAYLRQKGLRG